jgi:hypothetical protein
MLTRQRLPQTTLVAFLLVTGLFFSATCKESSSSPTAPGSAIVTGVVVSGDEASGPQGSTLTGVTVRVTRTGQSTQTDGAGNFSLSGVPAGEQEFEFSRSDLNARGAVSVSAGANIAVTASILRRSTVVVTRRGNGGPAPGQTPTPHGNAVEEIEGLVTANSGGTLTVFDQRLGSVVVNVTETTTIRKGGTSVLLSQVLIGTRVHVKALIETNGSFTALEIIVQDENTKTPPTTTATGTATPTATMTPTP